MPIDFGASVEFVTVYTQFSCQRWKVFLNKLSWILKKDVSFFEANQPVSNNWSNPTLCGFSLVLHFRVTTLLHF